MGIQGTSDTMDTLHRLDNLEIRQMDLSVTGDNSWTTVRAVGYAYQTVNGVWRFKFNISGTVTATGSETLTINGILFKNISGHRQAVSVYENTNNACIGYAAENTNTLKIFSDTTTAYHISGDVELDAKPSSDIVP